MHFAIFLAVTLLEQEHCVHQCRQFLTAAAMYSDKIIISLNVLNSNENAHAAQPPRKGKRVGCAAYAFSFELKILRLHRVLSLHISIV